MSEQDATPRVMQCLKCNELFPCRIHQEELSATSDYLTTLKCPNCRQTHLTSNSSDVSMSVWRSGAEEES